MSKIIPVTHSITAILSTILFIVFFVVKGYSAFWGILCGIIICIIISLLNGFRIIDLLNMALLGVKDAYIVLIIMALIGIIISVWMVSGTIPSLMYYGFTYLSNMNFVLAAFLISSFISLILGTSIGTISTAGIPLMGIGLGLGVPPHIVAGAIVSGAFLGDRTSPMSSSANLVSVITKTNIYENIKHMISTLVPVLIISTLFYFLIGTRYSIDENTLNSVNNLKELLNNSFNIRLILLLPPAVIILMSILKINIKYNLILGIFMALILGQIYQNTSLLEIARISVFGFNSKSSLIASIISGGGLIAVKGILLIVSSATALYGILEGTNMIKPLIKRFISNIETISMLIYKTCILGILVNIITLNQTLAIIIPGKSMTESFKKLNISQNTLARTIGDSATVIAPLIPWNINGLLISVALGTSVLKYAPFAVLCYLLPIVTLIFGHLKIIKRVPK